MRVLFLQSLVLGEAGCVRVTGMLYAFHSAGFHPMVSLKLRLEKPGFGGETFSCPSTPFD